MPIAHVLLGLYYQDRYLSEHKLVLIYGEYRMFHIISVLCCLCDDTLMGFLKFFSVIFLRMSSSCIHVTALLFRIEAANRNGLTNPACTSRQCVWNVPRERTSILPTRTRDMDFKASKFKKSTYFIE